MNPNELLHFNIMTIIEDRLGSRWEVVGTIHRSYLSAKIQGKMVAHLTAQWGVLEMPHTSEIHGWTDGHMMELLGGSNKNVAISSAIYNLKIMKKMSLSDNVKQPEIKKERANLYDLYTNLLNCGTDLSDF